MLILGMTLRSLDPMIPKLFVKLGPKIIKSPKAVKAENSMIFRGP